MIRSFLFAVILWCVTFALYVYPYNVMTYLLFDTKLVEDISLWIAAILAVVMYYYFRTHASGIFLSAIAHYGLGFGFIGFMVFHLGWLASSFLPSWRYEIGLVSVGCFICVSLYSLYLGRKLTIKPLLIEHAKLTAETKAIFISDIHLGSNSRTHLQAIINQIAPLDYDMLMIGGDLFDSSSFQSDDLTPLRQLDKPIYFITGNHEYYVKDHDKKLSSLESYGITTLHNEAVMFHDINLIGISDNQSVKDQAALADALCESQSFNLILVHQPALWQIAPADTDFMISGHTHQGQIFPFQWLVRLQFKTVYGLFKRGESSLYVSSGAATWGPPMRLGTQNEIIYLTFRGADN